MNTTRVVCIALLGGLLLESRTEAKLGDSAAQVGTQYGTPLKSRSGDEVGDSAASVITFRTKGVTVDVVFKDDKCVLEIWKGSIPALDFVELLQLHSSVSWEHRPELNGFAIGLPRGELEKIPRDALLAVVFHDAVFIGKAQSAVVAIQTQAIANKKSSENAGQSPPQKQTTSEAREAISRSMKALTHALLNLKGKVTKDTRKEMLNDFYAAAISIHTFGAPDDFRAAFKSYLLAAERMVVAADKQPGSEAQRKEYMALVRSFNEAYDELVGVAGLYGIK